MRKHKGHLLKVHLNPNVSGLKPSATVAINDLSNELRQQGKEVFKLGLGQSPFPVPEPVVEALKKNAYQKDYLPVKGLRELQEAVAEHHCRTFGIEADPDDVLIGPGSKELMFLLQLTYYGDLVIPTPSWVSYAPQAKIIGRDILLFPTSIENDWHLTPEELEKLCFINKGKPRLLILNYPLNPTGSIENDWHLTPEELEKLCFINKGKPRLLILNYPLNPTGTTMSRDRLKDLAEIADRNRVVLLSDEIYGKIHHDGQHESIVPFYPEGTIFSGGLSKWCGAGGWRLGVFVFPRPLRWLLDAMAAVGTETFTSTSAPIQYAAIRAFQEGPEIDDYLIRSRRIVKALGNHISRKLEDAGALIRYPHGGFYIFPDFSPFKEKLLARKISTSEEMCQRLLEDTGVAILPGSNFGRRPEEMTARIAYVDFDGKSVLEAVKSVHEDQPLGENFLKTYCGNVLKAIDRMSEWIHAC
jgi:aspartate aminotransferase